MVEEREEGKKEKERGKKKEDYFINQTMLCI